MRNILMNSAAAAALGLSLAMTPATLFAADTTNQAEITAANSIDAEALIGTTVTTADGEDIGEVETLMVGSDGSIRNVVLGLGGFLGMGEKDVVLPWDRFTVSEGGDEVAVNATAAELEALPEFEWPDDYESGTLLRSDYENDADPSLGTQLAEDAEATGDAIADTAESAADGVAAAAGAAAEGAEQAVTSIGGDDGEATMPVQQIAASELIGTDIQTPDGDDVGEVNDIVLSSSGQIEGVLVDVGGFLGIDEKQVMLSWNDLELMQDDDEDLYISVSLNQDALEALPEYQAKLTY